MGNVVVVATMDTKGIETEYVVAELQRQGASVSVLNIGIFDPKHCKVPVYVTAQEIAAAGGEQLQQLQQLGESGESRAHALAVMTKGLTKTLVDMFHQGKVDAVFGFGGSSGSATISSAMQALPVGVPKILLTTMACGDVSPYIGAKDIALMYSVTDIAGLNRISKTILTNAARAAAGMSASGPPAVEAADRPVVAISMFGVTTPAVLKLQERLENKGFETTVFHATGAGGRAMEGLIEDGFIDAVVDLTTSELTDELVGGVLTAGPHRMEAAGKKGIPQVLVPGALEVVNFGVPESVPEKFRTPERRLHSHNPTVTIVRTNSKESSELGMIFSRKANLATGPTVVVLPLLGLSALDAPGEPYEDKESDECLFHEIRENLRSDIKLVQVPAAINSDEFVDVIEKEFDNVWANRRKEP